VFIVLLLFSENSSNKEIWARRDKGYRESKATRLRDPTDASADTARAPPFWASPNLKKHEVPSGLAEGLLLEP
jgi:hypothetical protein